MKTDFFQSWGTAEFSKFAGMLRAALSQTVSLNQRYQTETCGFRRMGCEAWVNHLQQKGHPSHCPLCQNHIVCILGNGSIYWTNSIWSWRRIICQWKVKFCFFSYCHWLVQNFPFFFLDKFQNHTMIVCTFFIHIHQCRHFGTYAICLSLFPELFKYKLQTPWHIYLNPLICMRIRTFSLKLNTIFTLRKLTLIICII